MFTTNYETFKIQQEELHRRADHYRLVKSLESPLKFQTYLIHLVSNLVGLWGKETRTFVQVAR